MFSDEAIDAAISHILVAMLLNEIERLTDAPYDFIIDENAIVDVLPSVLAGETLLDYSEDNGIHTYKLKT